MPTVSGLGENRLLELLLAELPPAVRRPRGALSDALDADDCALVRPPRRGRRLLLKTDGLIAGVHFTPDTDPALVGRKALARALSDIAAAGGKPRHALVALALPADITLEFARGLYHGLGACAEEHDVGIVGGETLRTPGPLSLTVTLTGAVRARHFPGRGGGRPSDVLLVTGRLGGSFRSGRHLTFSPRVREGRWLARHFPVRAMMDLSDGLGADLPRLARTSGCGFRVDRERLPRHEHCTIEQAIGDGEDYELLLALAPDDATELERRWPIRFPALPLTRIGELTAPGAGEELPRGHDHFA